MTPALTVASDFAAFDLTPAASKARHTRSAVPQPSFRLAPGRTAKNSSPPTRLTISPGRRASRATVAKTRSTSSPNGMAERVVDALEVVEIEDHHG